MPDWTYIPLRRIAAGMAGERRSQRLALNAVGRLASMPWGSRIVQAMDYTHHHPEIECLVDEVTYTSPVGVVVSGLNSGHRSALLAMGYGFVTTTVPNRAVVLETTELAVVIAALDAGAPLVVVNNAVRALGPTFGQRVNEVLAERARSFVPAKVDTAPSLVRFWSWPAWMWAMWLGIAMVCAGIGAAIIAVGPVLLGYDREFLAANTSGLNAINARLVPFLQHDRITMAGCMAAIGLNDIGLALGMRRGWRWAHANFAIAGAIGFPTFFLFLGYRFLDPLHLAVAVGFFPLYLLGVFGRKVPANWRVPVDVNEAARHRALVGQLMMVTVSIGVLLSGIVIMVVGLTDVLIPSDRAYLGDSQAVFKQALDGRLLRFVAHDRAGFGGALSSLGAGILGTTLWGWRAGERSTFWTLLAASGCGFGAALAVHLSVGYTDTLHLLPVYLGLPIVGAALLLSREWFLGQIDE
jgi:hypothetical protein